MDPGLTRRLAAPAILVAAIAGLFALQAAAPVVDPKPAAEAPVAASDTGPSVDMLVKEASALIDSAPKARPKVATPPPPPPPPPLVRSPTAILQVLDKVTAETMKFAVPVGKRVRYKTLLVEVKACETRGLADPQPRPSAYLLLSARNNGAGADLATRQLFKGWVFANAPGVHALEHPTYDLWLVSCSEAPPAR